MRYALAEVLRAYAPGGRGINAIALGLAQVLSATRSICFSV
jgi:hypothetical protein